jgi:nicotinate-nucleotide adenylyltransferase
VSTGHADILPRHLEMPPVRPGMAVGLFGGSFNPPHEGHALIAKAAIDRLGLDRLWWMVTPGNPLKEGAGRLPLAERLRLSEEIAADPRIDVTAFEARYELRYTADTLALVKKLNPGVDFVWIMGADSLRDLDRWHRWQEIFATVPVAVMDRPGATRTSLGSVAAATFAAARIEEKDAGRLARMAPPAWVFLHGPRSKLSSTAIRNAAARGRRVPNRGS